MPGAIASCVGQWPTLRAAFPAGLPRGRCRVLWVAAAPRPLAFVTRGERHLWVVRSPSDLCNARRGAERMRMWSQFRAIAFHAGEWSMEEMLSSNGIQGNWLLDRFKVFWELFNSTPEEMKLKCRWTLDQKLFSLAFDNKNLHKKWLFNQQLGSHSFVMRARKVVVSYVLKVRAATSWWMAHYL